MGLKRNFTYSCLLTLSSYFFPILTYPYVSRVLGVSGMGTVNYVDSIIDYSILISMMGTSMVGIRAIASNKTDKAKLSQVFSSLFVLNAVSTVIAIVIVAGVMFTVPQLQPYRNLLSIGIVKIFMNLFLTEWLFVGLEDFPYITKRTLIIKCLYVAGIFAFVREQQDSTIYYILSVSSVVINALVNIHYANEVVKFSFHNIQIKPYLAKFLSNGLYKLVTSLYLSMNVAWLGFVTDTIQVGYYTTATKLYTIIIALFTAFTSVMMPRLSSLLSLNNTEEFWQKINMSFEAVLFFTLPVITYSVVFGDRILSLIVGEGFEGAYLPFRMIMPMILILGVAQVFVIQIQLPMKEDSVVLRNAVLGAAVAVIINATIVKQLGAVGSALTWICSEITVTVASYITIKKLEGFRFPFKRSMKYITMYVPLLVILAVAHEVIHFDNILLLFATAATTLLYSFLVQWKCLKSEIFLLILKYTKLDRQFAK